MCMSVHLLCFLLENSVKLKLIKVHEIVRVFVYSSTILRCKHWDSWVLTLVDHQVHRDLGIQLVGGEANRKADECSRI